MSARRLVKLAACTLGLVLMIGVVQAGAQGSPTVLKFYDAHGNDTGVGFDINNQNAVPPIGSSIVTTLELQNIGSQVTLHNIIDAVTAYYSVITLG